MINQKSIALATTVNSRTLYTNVQRTWVMSIPDRINRISDLNVCKIYNRLHNGRR